MAQHTPGPWQVDYELLATFENDGRTEELIEIVGDERGNTPCYATSKADARLIAAAPDLLAALKDAQEALFWHKAENFENERGEKAGDVVRAAIAKAEGRT